MADTNGKSIFLDYQELLTYIINVLPHKLRECLKTFEASAYNSHHTTPFLHGKAKMSGIVLRLWSGQTKVTFKASLVMSGTPHIETLSGNSVCFPCFDHNSLLPGVNSWQRRVEGAGDGTPTDSRSSHLWNDGVRPGARGCPGGPANARTATAY
jgi:hypothetical protein